MRQKPPDGTERRKRERVPADLPVRLTVIDESLGANGLKFYGGRAVNLSQEGIAVETFDSSGVELLGDCRQLSAEITMPDSPDAIMITGGATWGTKIHDPFDHSALFRLGLKISEISPPDAVRLKAYIEEAAAGLPPLVAET